MFKKKEFFGWKGLAKFECKFVVFDVKLIGPVALEWLWGNHRHKNVHFLRFTNLLFILIIRANDGPKSGKGYSYFNLKLSYYHRIAIYIIYARRCTGLLVCLYEALSTGNKIKNIKADSGLHGCQNNLLR